MRLAAAASVIGTSIEWCDFFLRAAVHRFGPRGCTALMAQEFGDHPDAAARRMRWARRARGLERGAVSTPEQDSRAQWRPADPAGTLTFTEQEHTS